jgi:hypothetical protein
LVCKKRAKSNRARQVGKTIILYLYGQLKQWENSEIIEWFDSIEFYINIGEVIVIKNLMRKGLMLMLLFIYDGDLMTVNADCFKRRYL